MHALPEPRQSHLLSGSSSDFGSPAVWGLITPVEESALEQVLLSSGSSKRRPKQVNGPRSQYSTPGAQTKLHHSSRPSTQGPSWHRDRFEFLLSDPCLSLSTLQNNKVHFWGASLGGEGQNRESQVYSVAQAGLQPTKAGTEKSQFLTSGGYKQATPHTQLFKRCIS